MKRLLHNWISFMALSGVLLLGGCTMSTTMPGASADKFSAALDAMNAEEYQRAEGLLLSINDREPDHAGVWANLGIVLSRQGRQEEALQALEKAIALNSGLAAAHNELGLLHRRAGRLLQAQTSYKAALAADQDYAGAHRNLGVLYDLYLADPNLALAHYQRFVELVPADKQVVKWIAELEVRVQQREAHNQ
ncbi:MAG: tetratricopeptide repeat protein [Gammaproteobacteria bacterium]|nr:tetratricopeptide repeat protein [Gammaproteobacteria bacterium]